MKSIALLLVAVGAATNAFAAKACDELKSEIAAKIEAKGVKEFTLEVVRTQDVGDKKVVGSCAGGTRKIVYAKK